MTFDPDEFLTGYINLFISLVCTVFFLGFGVIKIRPFGSNQVGDSPKQRYTSIMISFNFLNNLRKYANILKCYFYENSLHMAHMV
jgi:hypothetical protein